MWRSFLYITSPLTNQMTTLPIKMLEIRPGQNLLKGYFQPIHLSRANIEIKLMLFQLLGSTCHHLVQILKSWALTSKLKDLIKKY